MRDLLIAAAERVMQYLEGLNERGVAPDSAVVARLAELDIPLPDHPSEAGETLALLDSYGAATMAMAGPRFFGFVIGWALPAALESGTGGDHDLLHRFTLPISTLQVLAWMKLLARVQHGELYP